MARWGSENGGERGWGWGGRTDLALLLFHARKAQAVDGLRHFDSARAAQVADNAEPSAQVIQGLIVNQIQPLAHCPAL
ncbi:hypothetical protein LPJ66_009448, partial [Kickxella alabastrina]